MRLVVTHEQPDFDGLASLALAKVLFPGSVATVQGAIGRSVASFLRLYRDVLDLVDESDVDISSVTELIVVDTADPERIAPFDALLGRVPVVLYDHHPLPEIPVQASRGIVERVGATVTLLARELQVKGATVPPEVASLGLLGIHEDTGNLAYSGTTPADYQAAAFLLTQGASLQLVRRFARDTLTPEQIAFRERLHESAELRSVGGRPVVVAAVESDAYVTGVSGLVSELLEAHAADAALVAARMEEKTLVFARSGERFDSAAALKDAFGGSGHAGAAFGKSDLSPSESLVVGLAAFGRHAAPLQSAADIMSSPVRSVEAGATVAEAQSLLLVHGHNGMPVVDGTGAVVGVVSRRDVDRAMRHDLGQSGVTGFMSRSVVTAPPDATVPELEAMVLEHNVGRIPIVSAGRLVGIVTRADLIRSRHRREDYDEADALLSRLPPRARGIVALAEERSGDAPLYLVGGVLRDLMLGAGSKDLDIVIEGASVEAFAGHLQRSLGGSLACHVEFGTCTLALADGLVVDVATAREETYARPGALPDVSPSSVRNDLARRDFTVNAMALRLKPGRRAVLDPFGGRADLARRQLRVLHPLSFVEDPTRILRGARLAGRLSFTFAADTAAKAKAVVGQGIAHRVSHARLRSELELTLAEQAVAPPLVVMDELGVFEELFGLRLPPALEAVIALDSLRASREVPEEAYLLALLSAQPEEAATRHVEAFNWPRRLLASRARLERWLSGGAEASDVELEAATPAESALASAVDPALGVRFNRLAEEPPARRLMGRDVVALGLPEGPAVGRVLAEVERARSRRQTTSFEDELELAKRSVAELLRSEHRGVPE